MKKNILFFIAFISMMSFGEINCDLFSYINKKDITYKNYMTQSCVMPLVYCMWDSGDGGHSADNEGHSVGGSQRFCGIHNMRLYIAGYEPVDLVVDDFCEYPHLFTILGIITPNCLKYNFITQRSALVKWFMPLYFGFDIKNDVLIITSALTKYYGLAPMMAKQEIKLTKTSEFNNQNKINCIEVRVNGRKVVLELQQVLELYH